MTGSGRAMLQIFSCCIVVVIMYSLTNSQGTRFENYCPGPCLLSPYSALTVWTLFFQHISPGNHCCADPPSCPMAPSGGLTRHYTPSFNSIFAPNTPKSSAHIKLRPEAFLFLLCCSLPKRFCCKFPPGGFWSLILVL